MKLCTAAIGSLTYAIKAQRALEKASVSAQTVKLDAARTRGGCAYGVSFPCEESRRVRAVIHAEKIPVKSYIDGGGDLV